MTDANGFRPAVWLPGAHLQTAWGPLSRPRRLVAFRREVLPTPDGDELVLDHLDGARADVRAIVLHGLEGSSYSVYVQGVLRLLSERGIPATVMNYRSCAREPERLRRMIPNRTPRLYHSGETEDLGLLVAELRRRAPGTRLGAIGVSIGGNILLKWLGEHPERRDLAAGVAISAPFDLDAGGRHLERGLGPLYVGRFLRTLRAKAVEVARRHALPRERLDVAAAIRARSFREFDDAATGPLHGMRGADEYYATCSSIHYLGRITTPALCISAADDPFLPAGVLERVRATASPALELCATSIGGHAGFVSGVPWACRYWAEERAVEWLAGRLMVDD
ncbi:MAG TPA: alpha/beta fold hydrolase [Thermoanaerobaculia bacterium]|nr:alpha/beta fold hydrolase [Thermoanaerobaculia bacterium]